MKKIIYGGLLLTLVGTVFIRCQKDNIYKKNDDMNVVKDFDLNNIPIIPTTNGESFVNLNDKDEIKLNEQLYELASATKELTKNLNFNRSIIELAQNSGTHTVFYSQIKKKEPGFYDLINQKLKEKGTSIEDITKNMTHKPVNSNPKYPETEKLEFYEPSIMIPNIETLDFNKIPLISPNREKFYNDMVYIVAWFYNKNGLLDSTLINEDVSLKATNPLFILNHSIPYNEMKKIGDFRKKNEHSASQNILKNNSEYRISRIQIKNGYGYEQGLAKPRSEFTINACVVYNDGPANFVYLFLPDRNSKDWSQTVRKVTKSEVSSSAIINVDNFFSPNYSSYNNFVAVYWNTFERDWNRSPIDLGNSNSSDPYVWVLWGNARYASDWYQWIPSTTRIHPMPYEWFGWESSVKFESWKSSITIKPN